MSRVNGIRFNGLHSYYDFGLWLSRRPDWGIPSPKLNLVEIPGADGLLDLTEANSGEVKFSNRTIILTFAAMVEVDKQERFKARIRNAIHGKVCTITPDEDPDWSYSGRVSVAFASTKSWKVQFVITADANPYAMKNEDTVINLHDSNAMMDTVNIVRAKNIIDVPWAEGSDFRFGTDQFPNGILYADDNNAGTYEDIVIAWPAGANARTGHLTVSVYDSAGHSYTKNISASVSVSDGKTTQAGTAQLTISEITTAGVNAGKVWQITIGIADCELYTSRYVFCYRVWNERKTAIPVFSLLNAPQVVHGITVSVNDQDVFVEPGTNRYENVCLVQGWNDVLVTALDDGQLWQVMSLGMTFREGRL